MAGSMVYHLENVLAPNRQTVENEAYKTTLPKYRLTEALIECLFDHDKYSTRIGVQLQKQLMGLYRLIKDMTTVT